MREVLLDTNFILSCVKQKIDFFEELRLMGLQILIPRQVISEIKKIINSKKSPRFKENAKLSLKLLEKNSFKEIEIGKGHVDKAIIKFTMENKNVLIATLDREIKNKIRNQKLVIRGKKKLEII